jgi:hypothetical protein
VGLEWQDLPYVLIGPHDDQGTSLPVDTTQVENIVLGLRVGAEDLLVVDEIELPFARQEDRRHDVDRQFPMRLLADRDYLNHKIDVILGGCVSAYRRLR